MSTPSPGLFAAVLHMLRSSDPRERAAADSLGTLVGNLTSDEALSLPEALTGVIPLLRADRDRIRFAAELVSLLDLWEAGPALVELALAVGDTQMMMAAANLCGSRADTVEASERLINALGESPELARAAEIRVRSDVQPSTDLETGLFLQRWPGFRSAESRHLAPVVVIDPELDPARSIALAVELLRAGATVRRLPGDHLSPLFGPQTVVVCTAPTRTRILSYSPRFPEAQIVVEPPIETDGELASLLRQINNALPRGVKLRMERLRTELATSVLDPDVFALGVYETREASYLTTAPPSSIYRLAKKGLLEPRSIGVQVYSFRDLVAVRTWRFLNAQSGKRISSEIVPKLAKFPGDAAAVSLGATSDGHVLVNKGYGWEDVVTGALVMDLPVQNVDEAFRPFSVGGYAAPDLLQASQNTRLHPAILHGSPFRAGHRVTARALASLDRRGGHGAIRSAYPELEGENLADTIRIGHQMLAAG